MKNEHYICLRFSCACEYQTWFVSLQHTVANASHGFVSLEHIHVNIRCHGLFLYSIYMWISDGVCLYCYC